VQNSDRQQNLGQENDGCIQVRGARVHNLKNINIDIYLEMKWWYLRVCLVPV